MEGYTLGWIRNPRPSGGFIPELLKQIFGGEGKKLKSITKLLCMFLFKFQVAVCICSLFQQELCKAYVLRHKDFFDNVKGKSGSLVKVAVIYVIYVNV